MIGAVPGTSAGGPKLGTVVRWRVCDNVLMVFVEVRGVTCVDLRGLAWKYGARMTFATADPFFRTARRISRRHNQERRQVLAGISK